MAAADIDYSEMTPAQKLRALWHVFTDADPVPETFVEEMEAAGFCSLRPVGHTDIENDPFAYERGIEPGGMLWELTDAGRLVLSEPRS